MNRPDQIDPLGFPGCFAYLETDIPPGLSLAAWRAQTTREREPARADRAPQDRTLRVRGGAHRPRSGRGPDPRRTP
jgi:hypothetical protein